VSRSSRTARYMSVYSADARLLTFAVGFIRCFAMFTGRWRNHGPQATCAPHQKGDGGDRNFEFIETSEKGAEQGVQAEKGAFLRTKN
jgi:hypothetical protein